MYKVFFADDEAAMRTGIRDTIKWDESPFILSGEAPDGEMALSLIQEILPDILITDVKMPFMDGIELSKSVKKLMPWIKIIILSGHDEFEYAKQAITIGVQEYLLKPVTSEELMAVLYRVAGQVSEEQNELKKIDNFKRMLSDSRMLQIDKLLFDLAYGNIEIAEGLKKADDLELRLYADYYMIMMIEIRRSSSEGYDVFQSARSWAISILQKWENVLFFSQGSDRIVCLLKGVSDATLEENAFACAKAIKYETERNVPCFVSVAIGSVVSDIKALPKSLADADMAKRYLNFINQNQIISIKDINSSGLMPFAEINKLPILDKLRYGSKADVPQFLDNYFYSFSGSSAASFLFMNYVFVDILMAASTLIEEQGGDPGAYLAEYSNIDSIVDTTSSIDDFKEILSNIIYKAFEFRDRNTGSKYSDVITKAKEYIQNNFAQQGISLHSVAKEVNVSPNHFSTIFSQETGETFINYITKIRIESAKALLKTTNLRTSDIGYEVGYNDTHYFSYVFKKHAGMTPKEFRK